MAEELYCGCGQKADLMKNDWSSGIGTGIYKCPACGKDYRVATLSSEEDAITHYSKSGVSAVNMFKDLVTGQLLFSEAGYPWPENNPFAPGNAVQFAKTIAVPL